MPRRHYQHICKDHKLRMINWSPCNLCGAPGKYVGWNYSGIERMGHFQRLYGLAPHGPHHRFLEELPLYEWCEACSGKGLFDVEDGEDYERCGVCDGIGRRLRCSPEELDAAQQIARAIIRHHRSFHAGDNQKPVDRLLALIPGEFLRNTGRRLLDEGRILEVRRLLTWHGLVTAEDQHQGVPDDHEEDNEEEETLSGDTEDIKEHAGPYNSLEDLIRLLDGLKERGLIND